MEEKEYFLWEESYYDEDGDLWIIWMMEQLFDPVFLNGFFLREVIIEDLMECVSTGGNFLD